MSSDLIARGAWLARRSLERAPLALLLFSGAMVAGVLVGQFAAGLYPCHLCWIQRYPHFIVIALMALALALGPAMPRVRALLLAAACLALLTTTAYAVFHVGVEQGWIVSACSSTLGGAAEGGLAAIRARLHAAPVVPCNQVQFRFIWVSLAGWNALLSFPAALFAALAVRRAFAYAKAGKEQA